LLTYQNPVWAGALADPFVLFWEGTYYAYGTGSEANHGRQPNGRVIPVIRSADLVHWEPLGGALEPLADPALYYWAPGVAERDGTFYLYYSAGGRDGQRHRLRLARSASPAGPFRDLGRLLLPDEPFSIDAHPFRDPADGRWYLFFAKDFFDQRAGTGAAGVALADDMMTAVGEVRPLLRASADWQIFERNRRWYEQDWAAWHTVEGPYVHAREGRYYCFYSGGNWQTAGYGIAYGVADHPLGPYRDEWSALGPSVLRGTPEAIGPGHNALAVAPNGRREMLVYHAWDPALSDRRMCIDPLVWTPDGPRCLGPTTGLQRLDD
jgi:GH43 family beta-xylosidase